MDQIGGVPLAGVWADAPGGDGRLNELETPAGADCRVPPCREIPATTRKGRDVTMSGRISGATDLHQLVYVSQRVTKDVQISQSQLVESILRSSIKNNSKLNVTGALLACNDWFVQVLEGRRIDVDFLFERISLDKNHKNIRKITAGPINQRGFPQWSMCASTLSPTDQAIVEVLKTSGKFDANRLNGDSAMRLLLGVGRLQEAASV